MKLYFKITDEFIKEELKKGNELQKMQSLDINFKEISEDDRETILRHCVLTKSNTLLAGKYGYTILPTLFSYKKEIYNIDSTVELDGNTVPQIIECFKNFELERAELIKSEKADDEERISKFISGEDMILFSTGIYSDYTGDFDFAHLKKAYHDHVNFYGDLLISFDELKAKAEEYQKLADAKKEIRKIEAEKERSKRAEIEAKKAAEKEAFKNWAAENGDDLLKLRIKNNQNWQSLAEEQFALANSKGFNLWEGKDSDEEWEVKNATLEQLNLLETAKKENPDHEIDIIRGKFSLGENGYYDDDDIYHRTFLRCFVKTPLRGQSLFCEIDDVDEENE